MNAGVKWLNGVWKKAAHKWISNGRQTHRTRTTLISIHHSRRTHGLKTNQIVYTKKKTTKRIDNKNTDYISAINTLSGMCVYRVSAASEWI